KIGESLAPSARLVLERVGVWERHQAAGHLPCFANRSSWGGSEVDTYDFLRDPYGHGWHLDRRRFQAMLVDEAVRAGCAWREGWWYTALLPDGRLATAFMTDADLLRAGGGGRHLEWARRLAATTHTRARITASRYRPDEPPVVAAAGSALLDRAAGPGWAAAGDAAASYDPLSSHGIATALAAGWDAAGAMPCEESGS